MALEERETKKTKLAAELAAEEQKKNDTERLVEHIKDNPMLYIVGTAFVLFCLLAGGLYGLAKSAKEQAVRSEYAAVLQQEDPALVAAGLKAFADNSGSWTDEALYMLGEKSIEAESYPAAEEAFARVRDEFPSSQYAPRATDGLAFILENRGKFEEALAMYQEIPEKWPGSLMALRTPYNIGRVQESLENFEAAIEAYEEQRAIIEVLDDGVSDTWVVYAKAGAALDRLREEKPGLFFEPEPTPEADAEDADAEETPGAGTADAVTNIQ